MSESVERVNRDLLRELESRGMKGRIVRAGRASDLRRNVESLRADGSLDPRLDERYLGSTTFGPQKDLPHARSLIVAAVPDPQIRFQFEWQGRKIPAVVPPTYLHWSEVDAGVQDAIAAVLEPAGYSVVPASVPKKLLAVCSGLGSYGRNNVCYVEGMGSFHRLAAFFSDLPCAEDTWREPAALETCDSCRACVSNCPTGAISAERFVIDAARCLTLHNEEPSRVPFPDWIGPSAHGCLVGCLRCQSVCPENAGILPFLREGESFNEAETGLLADDTPVERLPPDLTGKLRHSGLSDYVGVIARNLRALLRASP